MEKYKKLLLIAASYLLLTACSDNSGTEEKPNVQEEPETEEVVKEAEAEEEEKEEQPIDDTEYGTRSNPIPYGDLGWIELTITDPDADYEEFDGRLEITVLDTIRGEEAAKIVSEENQFNEPAPDGKEFIINRLEIKLTEATSEDLKAVISSNDFDYVSESGASYNESFQVIPEALDVELYNNGTAEGNVHGLIDLDDSPILRFNRDFFFEAE